MDYSSKNKGGKVDIPQLIEIFEMLSDRHGGGLRVLINHEEIAEVRFVPEAQGRPAYISIESE